MFFTIDGQKILQIVFDFQFRCCVFMFGGVNKPIYCIYYPCWRLLVVLDVSLVLAVAYFKFIKGTSKQKKLRCSDLV